MSNEANATAGKYLAANDVTPNRCTVLGVYDSRDAAEEAAESAELARCFAVDGPAPAIGERAYHADGVAWGRWQQGEMSHTGGT